MRRLLLLSLLCVTALGTRADDLLGPADYLKILTESKLRYNLLSEPSKTPIAEMRCPRRDAGTRVAVKGKEKSLVEWKIKPEATRFLQEGEVFYQAKQYDQAAEKYKQAIAADAQAVIAYFSYGDALLFGPNDAAGALEQYQKGIALDPTLPLGYFFTSTAYMHLGRKADAREAIIKALTLHPAYEAVWNIAKQKPDAWNIKPVVRHPFEPPAGYLGAKGKNGVDIYSGTNGEFLGYAICKAVWANEAQFAKRRAENQGWSVEEERACVLNQAWGAYNAAESMLQKQRGETASIEESAVIAAMPPREAHIFEAAKEHLLDGYILFEIIGQKCPLALSLMQDDAREQVEQYIRRYVIVPAE